MPSIRPPNGTADKLGGGCPGGYANSGAVAAAVRVSIRAREICSQRDVERVMFGPGGSAAGPKPGRDGFSVELGGSEYHYRIHRE